MDPGASFDCSGDARPGCNACPPLEAFFREKLELRVGEIPSENENSFQRLIKGPRPANRPFEPKDQHCGIWNDSPNKECHASFGDQGTTASVSCYGSLMQTSQFLGAGNSGLFSIDHESTGKPYYVVDRADDLNTLSFANEDLSFGLHLPDRFLPNHVPKMKWVNWRWPRYEWEVSDGDTSAKISLQWLVKYNTVFQQIVITNTGDSPIENFGVEAKIHMLIRDLDYLGEPSYNGRYSDGYTRARGPNAFSWVTANVIDSENPATSQEKDAQDRHSVQDRYSGHEEETSQPTGVREDPHGSKHAPSDEELWRGRRMSDSWTSNDVHAVVSIMSLFVDGNAEKMGMGSIYRTIGASGSSSSVLEFTVAFKLMTIPKGQVHWRNFLVPAETADVSAMLAEETDELWGCSATECKCSPSLCDIGVTAGTDYRHSFTDSIEYLTWRHTEHILSVCAAPLSVPRLSREGEAPEPDASVETEDTSNNDAPGTSKENEVEPEIPIALTCGDMSGHRICTSASFFAFLFLMDMLRRLPNVKQTAYIVSLQGRIDAVCRGHIRWLEWVRKPWLALEYTESLLDSGCFAANYWVNGQIMPKGGDSWQPDDAITDTPFQILKVTAYVIWLRARHNIQDLEDQTMRHCMALLRDIWACWIPELDDLDKRQACAWSHANEDGLNTSRLDDHVWLWSSLTELHSLGLWNMTEASSKLWRNSPDRRISNVQSLTPALKPNDLTIASRGVRDRVSSAAFVSKAKRLLPENVQRAVIQRFTVENDVSQERMLAVTRSARETRFFFHSRDTTLFYGHKSRFFRPDTSFATLWERTIKSQSHHEETLQDEWHSPLRFALGVVAGLNGFSIDRRSSDELVRQSVKALVQVSAHNAFIPGEIDVTTREPSIFFNERDRDYYYHVGFEASHILLENSEEIDVAFRSEHFPDTEQKDGGSQQAERETVDLLTEILAQLKTQTSTYHPGNDYRAPTKAAGADGRFDRKLPSMVMKKSMPFNSMIDASSITLLDEEWLYNYPDFLLVKDIDLHHEVELLCPKSGHPAISRMILMLKALDSIIDRGLWSFYKDKKLDFTSSEVKDGEDGLVVSLPKQKRQRQRRGKRDVGASLASLSNPKLNETLWKSIGKARSAADGKKRFLWLPARSDSQTAFLCWLASTEAEKPPISLFFARHAEYHNHLWDDTTMVLNTWQTELHVCFWVLFDRSLPLHKGIPDQVGVRWPRGNTKELRRASIGFRFNGDFFDRYWTCHFIQYVPGQIPESNGVPGDWKSRFENEKQSWQRKVLELQLLQHMLSLMLTRSNEILEDIEQELGLKKGEMILSVLNTEAYSKSADHWQIYEELLGKAEEDLTSSLYTLSKWATREEDRGQERPRWTRNDERKYRGNINKLRSQTERQRWDLESSRDKIRKLREILATYQSKIRSDLEGKREQNIAYFTYVTVIFLPLGFAASFYSMNGAPTNGLIVSLAQFSAAAFAVTVILLFSAGTFIAILSTIKDVVNHAILMPLQRYSHNIREKSLLFRSTHPKNHGDLMDSSWFLPAYLFVEIPTHTVSSAWTALVSGTVSAGVVWKVVLGMVMLPIYLMSQPVLFLFSNTKLLLKITIHLSRISRLQLAKDQVAPDKRDDFEKNTIGNRIFPDHFQKLIPTAEPLRSLQSLETNLRWKTRELKRENDES